MSKVFTLTLAVYAKVAMTPDEETGEYWPDYSAKDVEKSVIAALRRVGFDTDLEVMETAVVDEDSL